ncbi:MAG: hypothetical protein ACLQLC_02335 [Candidatus Sulfotelmatobacter sp.]
MNRESMGLDEAAARCAPIEKLIHLALPVRLIHMRNGERGPLEMVCTYDVHPRGARLRSAHAVSVGDHITIERGRTKTVCRVIWTAAPDSELRGQFTVESVEGSKVPWEQELSQMEEQYLPVNPGAAKRTASRFGGPNRRRRPRYVVAGGADFSVIGGRSTTEGRLEQIGEFGCLVRSESLLAAGTGLRLVLNLCDLSVALRGQVRYAIAEARAMGVEFESIRQGDRPLFDYVLDRLKKPRVEDFTDLEVVTELTEAAAG